jgi:hypothetical protein
MVGTRKYYLKNNYLTWRSKVITACDTPPYSHAPTYQISFSYLERQKCYGPDKQILFDLEVKGQWHTALCSCTQISLTYLERQKCYGPDKKILFKKQLFDLQVKGQGPTTHHLVVRHPHTKYNWPISKDKKVMVRTSFAEKKQKKRKRKKKKSD